MKALGELATLWPQLNGLLDEALSLPPSERAGWLRALPAEHAALKDTLARLLDLSVELDTGDFLATLPRRGGQAVSAPDAPDGGAPRPGDEVGPYRLVRELGEGGMGSVWLAERADGQLRRQVALKLPRLTWARGLAVRMARERDILASLEHPRIARLYDAGVDRLGRPWLALEVVQGRPIDVHAREQALTVRERVALLLQVCDAVAYAHSRLVVHRDLKPSNILVTDDGQVRLLDFGIAKLAQPAPGTDARAGDGDADRAAVTELAGAALTPGYASPEQLREEPLSTASDVFSLGVVAYELLAGVPPYRFSPRTVSAYERALGGGAPPLASSACADGAVARALRGDLDAVLDRALQPAVAARYAGADDLAADLRAWFAGEAVSARPRSRVEQLRHWAVRHKAVVASAAFVAVTLVASAAVSTWQALRAREQAVHAAAEAERARKEAARAQATQALLRRIFQLNSMDQPDPLRAQRTTVRELLDLAARSADEVMKDTPDAHIDLLETLAALYAQLGAPVAAADVARRRVDLVRQALPDDDPRRADALLSLAGRLHDTPERATARALIEEAEAVMRRAGAAADALQGALVLQKARHERWGRLKDGLAYAEQAVAWLRRPGADPGLRLSALYFASVLNDMAGDPARGLAHLQEAREIALARGESGGRALVTAVAERADLLARHGRLAEAEAAHAEAVQVTTRYMGADHRSTLVTSIQRARFLIETGRVAEGTREWEAIQARMRTRQPPLEDWWLDYARSLMGRLDLDRGRPDLLEPAVRKDIAWLRGSVPRSHVMAVRQHLLADVLAAQGRLDEAEAALAEAEGIWREVTAGLDRPGLDHALQVTRAGLQLARGDAQGALARLDALPRSAGLTAYAVDPSAVKAQVLRAAALRALGRPDEAVAAARQALAELARLPAPIRWPALEADAALALGLALREAGHRADAAGALRHAAAVRRAFDLPGSQWRARAEAALQGRAP